MSAGEGQADERGIITVANRSIELKFEPATGLVKMRFIPNAFVGTAEDAAWLLHYIQRFGGGRERIGYLIDCKQIAKTDARWRATLAEYFQRRPPFRSYLAWYNMTLLIRVTVEMFAIVTPCIEGKAFAFQTDARTWLRERGIG